MEAIKIGRNGNFNPETGIRSITLYALTRKREKNIIKNGSKELTNIIKNLSDVRTPYIMTDEGKKYVFIEKNDEVKILSTPSFFVEGLLMENEALSYFLNPYYKTKYYETYGDLLFELLSDNYIDYI